MIDSKCKICRRLGQKLFLKGERCLSPKCPMIKRPYPPGKKSKRGNRGLSEYGKELREKQKLRFWYGLEEKQLKNYVKEILGKRGKTDAESALLQKLETRLDNVIFRLGFATSHPQARQMVGHGYFQLNGKKVNYPSYQIKKGNKISISPRFTKKNLFQNLKTKLKKYNPPSWLELDKEKLEGR